MNFKSKIKAFILDDEGDAIQALQKILLFACPEIEVIGSAQTIEEAYHKINTTLPELVFLDIDLKEKTSFELLNLYDHVPFKIIFITGHDEYALKAIKYAALDYILKPVNSIELIAAVKKVNNQFHSQGISVLKESLNQKSLYDKIALHVGDEINIVEVQQIVYCEADGNFTAVFLKNQQKLYVSRSLKELDYLLMDKGFFRVHKSYLINTAHVKSYNQKTGEEIIMENKYMVPIAARKKQDFFLLMSSLLNK